MVCVLLLVIVMVRLNIGWFGLLVLCVDCHVQVGVCLGVYSLV